MAELGKIERPAAENYIAKKKLYCVPHVLPFKDAPDDYRRLVETYWHEVAGHIERLEAAGKVRTILFEGVLGDGEEAFDALAALNELALEIVKKKVAEGAALLPLEDPGVFAVFIDWANCINIVRTREVFDKIFEFYKEAAEQRLRHIEKVIADSIAEGEAALLIIRDEDRMKLRLPKDLEVFLVTPPSYDDIVRWVRERMQEGQA